MDFKPIYISWCFEERNVTSCCDELWFIYTIYMLGKTGCYTEYMKMSDKSTANAMFASLCANYEGSKKVREAKALMLGISEWISSVWVVQNERWWKYWANVLKISDSSL